MAKNNKIDVDLVSVLKSNYDEINSSRVVAQKEALIQYGGFRKYYDNTLNPKN